MNCFFLGLEFIEEVKNDRGVIVSYNCQLCVCSFTDPNAKRVHLKGRRHRLQYKVRVSVCSTLMLPLHLLIRLVLLYGDCYVVARWITCRLGIFDSAVTCLLNDLFKIILIELFEFSSSQVLLGWCWRDGLFRKKSIRGWRLRQSQIQELKGFVMNAWRSRRQRNLTGSSRIFYLEWGR